MQHFPRRPALCFLTILLCLSALSPVAADNLFTRADESVIDWVRTDLESARLTDAMENITRLGDTEILLGSLLLWTAYGDARHAETGKLATSALIGSGLVTFTIKRIVSRERPDATDRLSFPSGHATKTFAVATVFAQEHPRLSVPAYAAAALVALSRVYLERHYPSDVIAGALVGAVTGYLVHRHRGALLRIEF